MTIHKAKASNYNSVRSECIGTEIYDMTNKIYHDVARVTNWYDKDRTQLKAIAAELETVCKRLDYILEGRY